MAGQESRLRVAYGSRALMLPSVVVGSGAGENEEGVVAVGVVERACVGQVEEVEGGSSTRRSRASAQSGQTKRMIALSNLQ